MKRITTCFLLAPLLLSTPSAFAKVYQTPSKSHQLETVPLSITGSADGKYTYILNEGGKIDIYKENGEQETLNVSAEFDTIFKCP